MEKGLIMLQGYLYLRNMAGREGRSCGRLRTYPEGIITVVRKHEVGREREQIIERGTHSYSSSRAQKG